MSVVYKTLFEILKKWPLDKTKGVRDLGFHLRERLKLGNNSGKFFEGSEAQQLEHCRSLQRLVDNKYKKIYRRNSEINSSGLTLDQCHQVLSDEMLKQLNK